MEILKGKILKTFPLKNSLVRIVDVMNFEGPLLALFKNTKTNQLYLFDWVDSDNQANRWVIFKSSAELLNRYIKQEITYYDLFLSIDNDCYTVDINSNFQWLNPQKFTKNQLPESYYPSKDGLFDISDCPNFSKLQHFISEEIADEKPIAASFVYKQSKSLEKKPIFSNILY